MVQATLAKHRMGDGNSYGRLYSKARIVRVAPSYKNDFASYSENIWESWTGSLRFLDCPMTLIAPIEIGVSDIGNLQTYAVEHLAGDGRRGEVCFGAPLVIVG